MSKDSTNNVLYDVVKDLISEEDIRDIIREEIAARLSSYQIEKIVRDALMEYVHEKGEAYLRETVEKIVNGPVRLDDGWGNVKEMGSFEDYARKSLRDQCMSQWGMERKLREMVDAKLKKIAQDIVGRHIKEDLQNEVIAELVKEVNGKK